MPSQPWTQHRAAIAERVTADAVIDTVLSPGDALYLPRGWVHSAQALDTTSIHLTIGVAPSPVSTWLAPVVEQLASLEDFRESLPMGGVPTDRDEMARDGDER